MFAQYLFLARVQFTIEDRITHPRAAKAACEFYIRNRCSFSNQETSDGGEARELGRRTGAVVGVSSLAARSGAREQTNTLLEWYGEVFTSAVTRNGSQMLCIGYGFGDEHVVKESHPLPRARLSRPG